MDTTHIATLLTNEKDELTKELSTIAVYDATTDEWTAIPDPADNGNADENVEADSTEDWNTRRAVTAQLSTRYRNINRALAKIDAGTYGICEISGEPIESDRLTANPAARTCKAHVHEEGRLTL